MGGRPYVVAYLAVSADGATNGFEVDVAGFFSLVSTWQEDVTLTGANTILAQKEWLERAGPGPGPGGPLLAVVDSRARVSAWSALREAGRWRVDLSVLFDLLGRHGAKVVRVGSGGRLVRALLDAGLLDELSLLVRPRLAGGSTRTWSRTSPAVLKLDLVHAESQAGGLIWLRYRIPPAGERADPRSDS